MIMYYSILFQMLKSVFSFFTAYSTNFVPGLFLVFRFFLWTWKGAFFFNFQNLFEKGG